MADPDRGTPKVSQSAIKEIQQLGMSKAISKYTSGGGSAEFRTAVERYYSPKRLKDASNASKSTSTTTTKTTAKPAATSEPKTVPMPASAPAAATRKVGGSRLEQDYEKQHSGQKSVFPSSSKKSKLEETYDRLHGPVASTTYGPSTGKKKGSTKLPKGKSIFD